MLHQIVCITPYFIQFFSTKKQVIAVVGTDDSGAEDIWYCLVSTDSKSSEKDLKAFPQATWFEAMKEETVHMEVPPK